MTSAVGAEQDVTFTAADGWAIAGSLHLAGGSQPQPGTLLVPATRHERDGYGPAMLAELGSRGVAALRIDIRGRGGSRLPTAMYELPPGHRRRLPGDVAGAIDLLAERPEIDADRLVVVAEQDMTDPAIHAAAGRAAVQAWVLLSPRLTAESQALLAEAGKPVLLLASREDRRALGDGVGALGDHPQSSVRILDGLGFGTTMFSAWQFLHADEEPLETTIAAWIAQQVTTNHEVS